MKRSLVERAKQSSLKAAVQLQQPPAAQESPSTGPVHHKPPTAAAVAVPPPQETSINDPASRSEETPKKKVVTAGTTSSSSSSKRRLSSESSDSKHNNNNNQKKQKNSTTTTTDDSAAFYLRHQNRALATELQSLQFAVRELQTERDARREHCRAAFRSVVELAAVWGVVADQDQQQRDAITASSTGTGDAVEWTVALQRALVALGASPAAAVDQDTVLQRLSDTAQQLRERLRAAGPQQDGVDDDVVASLRARCVELEEQSSEMATSRQHVCTRERRVRRNLYRMSAGILTPDQVVKALELDGEDNEIEAEVRLEKEALSASPNREAPDSHAGVVVAVSAEATTEIAELKQRIESLDSSIKRSEEAIKDLNVQIAQKEARITELSQRQLSAEDATRLEQLESTKSQLEKSENTIASLQKKLTKQEECWSETLGNEKALIESSNQLIAKFNKRWEELTGQCVAEKAAASNGAKCEEMTSEPVKAPGHELTKQVNELQHKMEQALEHARQAETTRENLKMALEMNGSIQAQLDEVKAKYADVQSARNISTTPHHHPVVGTKEGEESKSSEQKQPPPTNGNDTKSVSSNDTTRPSTNSSDAKAINQQKLYESYKRAKRQVEDLTRRKDTLKSKLERTEKDRDTLLESNRKLLKQIGEKDEMNATSLSTILQLKGQTDKLTVERNMLEEQAKAASQLALAARLATNAKEKVSEEVLLEKERLENRVRDLEKESTSLRTEFDRISQSWSEASGKMAVKELELKNAVARSNELVLENEQKRAEIRKLMGVVGKAEQESRAATEALENARKSGIVPAGENSSSSTFSVDQLQTQISFLKNRLACPVCHYRDKQCIILRCRHMHCKQCVDERIINRSRKCPTCNVKFSENDVGDVWLN